MNLAKDPLEVWGHFFLKPFVLCKMYNMRVVEFVSSEIIQVVQVGRWEVGSCSVHYNSGMYTFSSVPCWKEECGLIQSSSIKFFFRGVMNQGCDTDGKSNVASVVMQASCKQLS